MKIIGKIRKIFLKDILNKKNAQTALELGVFGSILIFVIASIVKFVNTAGYQQNQALKAMRWAMTMSEKCAEGYCGALGGGSRSSASVLVVEDRLYTTSAKYGSVDRVPYMNAGGATHTNMLFFPINDFQADKNQIGVTDYFINGKHFVFTTSAFKVVCLTEDPNDCDILGEKYYGHDEWIGNTCGAKDRWWDTLCATYYPEDKYECSPTNECVPLCPNYVGGTCQKWDPYLYDSDDKPNKWPRPIECPKFMQKKFNNNEHWCVSPQVCDAKGNLPEDERFDLDRDGVTSNPPDPIDPDIRAHFAWQWYRILGFVESGQKEEGEAIEIFEVPRYPTAAQLSGLVPGTDHFPKVSSEENEGILMTEDDQHNLTVDVDCDLKEETVIGILRTTPKDVIQKLAVQDYQEGDIDSSFGTRDWLEDPTKVPGFTSNASMVTIVNDGTSLLIEEGKLYKQSQNEKQYIRSATMKDQVDLIERVIQLSNDTGRFCDASGDPVKVQYNPATGKLIPNAGFWDKNTPNPVEVCCATEGCCYAAGRDTQTCMDTSALRIYVRSKVKDLRGRKWITESRMLK